MQITSNQDWTEITNLEENKTYILQAICSKFYLNSDNISEIAPISAMWYQGSDAPNSSDIGLLGETLKVSGSIPVYVKPITTPCKIIIQEIV